jgi:hypothetical protein
MTPAPAVAILEGANQPRREIVPQEILKLGHHEFIQRLQDVEIAPLDETGILLRFCASVEAHQAEPPGPGSHQGATTLAIRMDRAVAMELFRQLRELAETMGWPRLPEA